MGKQQKLTLKDKQLLSEHVTGETKRCLAIVNKLKGIKDLELIYKELVSEIIKQSPYIEFHPELLKRVPK